MGRKGPSLNRTLVIFFGDAFSIDGSRPNRCIQSLTMGRMNIPWAGNLLVFRAREPTSLVERYEGATMEDVKPMTVFFRDYSDAAPF